LETDTLQSSFPPGTGVLNTSETSAVLVIAIILLLLLIFIRSSETACFSNATDKELQKKRKFSFSKRFLKILKNQESLKSTFIILKGIINISVVISLVYLFSGFTFFTEQSVQHQSVLILLIVSILLILGEIVPLLLAGLFPVLILKIAEWPLITAEFLLSPITGFFSGFPKFQRNTNGNHRTTLSMEDITQALKMSNDPVLEEDKEILEGIVKFGNKNVGDIMKPRVDVVSLDIKSSFSAVLNVIVDSGFSRIPVYSGSFDNIKGVLYIKDILLHSHKGNSFNWQTLIRPPFYVPETKKINSLLGEFQKNKVHLAIVIDEYGGTSGIVTLEDVLEEIVGEIVDEFDEEDHFFSRIDEKTWLFDGKILLSDFIKTTRSNELDFEDIKGDSETLAGLILELKGAIPQLHEKIVYNQYTFTIEEADERRIKKIKVEIDKNTDDE
jgi:gliding motility-associated protein GldE